MCKKHVSGGHLEHLRWSHRYLPVNGCRHSESLIPLRGAGAAAGAARDTPGCETWKSAGAGAAGDTPGCETWNRSFNICFSSSNSFCEKTPSSRSDLASLNALTYCGSIGAIGAQHKLHQDNATVTVCLEGYKCNDILVMCGLVFGTWLGPTKKSIKYQFGNSTKKIGGRKIGIPLKG